MNASRPPDEQPLAPGAIATTLAGAADLRVAAVVREAWAAIDGIKGMINAGMALIYTAMTLAVLAIERIFSVAPEDPVGQSIAQLVIMALLYPFLGGVFMFGLRRSVGLPVRFEDQFGQYGRAVPILAVAVLQSFLTGLGFLLLVIPGIYLSIALSLALPLKVERDLPVVECLATSVRLVNRKFLQVAALSVASGLLMGLGILSLIGWIWTLPWVVMIYAITYRQLAGLADSGPGAGKASGAGTSGARATAEY